MGALLFLSRPFRAGGAGEGRPGGNSPEDARGIPATRYPFLGKKTFLGTIRMESPRPGSTYVAGSRSSAAPRRNGPRIDGTGRA